MEWTEDDEICLFRTLIKCRPVGIHQAFRSVNLFVALNHDTQDAPRISMDAIRQKLDALYDMAEIQGSAMDVMTARLDGEVEGDSTAEEGIADPDGMSRIPGSFELPYAEYRELIEARAINGVAEEERAVSSRGSPTSAHGRMQEDDEDDEEALSEPEEQEGEEEDGDDEEEESEEDDEEAADQAAARSTKKKAANQRGTRSKKVSPPASTTTTKRQPTKRRASKLGKEDEPSETESARPARGARKSARKR